MKEKRMHIKYRLHGKIYEDDLYQNEHYVIEETADAMESMASCFAKYWKSVKEDEPNASFTDLKDVEFWAKNVAAEAIQVAAMCKKACAYLDGEYYVSIDYEKLDGEKRNYILFS